MQLWSSETLEASEALFGRQTDREGKANRLEAEIVLLLLIALLILSPTVSNNECQFRTSIILFRVAHNVINCGHSVSATAIQTFNK